MLEITYWVVIICNEDDAGGKHYPRCTDLLSLRITWKNVILYSGKFWRLASDPSKFSLSIFSIQFNCIANTGCLRDYPSIFPPSTSEWSQLQSVKISRYTVCPWYIIIKCTVTTHYMVIHNITIKQCNLHIYVALLATLDH